MKRRQFLAVSAATTTAALAGCGAPSDDGGSDETGDETSEEPGGYSLNSPQSTTGRHP